MTTLTPETTVMRSPDMIATAVEDSIVMLSIELGSYFELNPVASAIWDLTGQPCAVAAIQAGLLQQFDVEPDRCEREVLSFLNDMIERGVMIQTSPSA